MKQPARYLPHPMYPRIVDVCALLLPATKAPSELQKPPKCDRFIAICLLICGTLSTAYECNHQHHSPFLC
jgi:hypothetical protein